MTLRARIFFSTFSLSILLLGAAAIGVARLSAKEAGKNLRSVSEALDRLSRLAELAVLERADPSLEEGFAEALAPLRKDLARRTVLERDVGLSVTLAWIGFFVMEATAALIVTLAASRYLTARWARLRDGMLALRRGEEPASFFSGASDEFGEVEMELDRLVAALADRERARSELRALQGWGEASAFLAHQARTPLASLTLSAQTARAALGQAAGAGASSLALPALERVEADAYRIAALFSRVRSMSGFKDPELEVLDPAEAFREAAATLAARGGGERLDPNGAVASSSGDGPLPRLDRAYIVEAFANLLANSLEACSERGLPFGATLAINRGWDRTELRYVDAVVGVDPELAAKVGKARFTTKPQGSGLGVWLVERIVALHGGSLSISLGAAGGLVFDMSFPTGRAEHG